MGEPAVISAVRLLISQELEKFLSASRLLGGAILTISEDVAKAFNMMLDFVQAGVSTPRPEHTVICNMIQPLLAKTNEIEQFSHKLPHDDKFFNHISMIAASIASFNWIAVTELPAKHVRLMKEAGDYFGNRVLTANKGNKVHITFVKEWQALLAALENYVKQYHRTGFEWNCVGGSGSSGSAPPPPPPPPKAMGGISSADTTRSALFLEINKQGENIAQILKPVGSVARNDPAEGADVVRHGPVRANVKAPPSHPPKFELQGRKWCMEYMKDDRGIVVNNNDFSESLLMYKCENVGVEVKNKMNGATLDNIKRSVVVLQDIISCVELINCSYVTLYCYGRVPTITVDKSECIQISLCSEALGVELVTSHCTAVNICVPKEGADNDFNELAVPEQIRSVILNGKIHSTPRYIQE